MAKAVVAKATYLLTHPERVGCVRMFITEIFSFRRRGFVDEVYSSTDWPTNQAVVANKELDRYEGQLALGNYMDLCLSL